MGRLLVMLLLLTAAAGGDSVNWEETEGAMLFSAAKEETDVVRNGGNAEGDPSSAAVGDGDSVDGGFSSLDGMLQWAIGHSDPAKLKASAQDTQRLSPGELKKRQMEIKELVDKLKTPSDAQLMQMAIDELNNSTLSLEDHHRALQELLVLVEPIDNANDLHKLGGLSAIIRKLNHSNSDIRMISAWVLGKAIQNNDVVQKQVLELGALSKLMRMVRSTSVEEAIKALYAVSALIRDNVAGQELFYAEAGDRLLQDIVSNSSSDIRLCRKVVSLVADLAEGQLQYFGRTPLPFLSNPHFLKSVVDLLASNDFDLQEKALTAVKNLLQLRAADALVFRDSCSLDDALERLREQLSDQMLDESQRDYAADLESLRREVELGFHAKLRNGGTVFT